MGVAPKTQIKTKLMWHLINDKMAARLRNSRKSGTSGSPMAGGRGGNPNDSWEWNHP